MTSRPYHALANAPNDLERFFVERVNAGDVDGLVALYEPGAVLVTGTGQRLVGVDSIRAFFVDFLAGRPRLQVSAQAPAIQSGDLALTSSGHSDGSTSVEIARRQPDGGWLWVVDRFSVG